MDLLPAARNIAAHTISSTLVASAIAPALPLAAIILSAAVTSIALDLVEDKAKGRNKGTLSETEVTNINILNSVLYTITLVACAAMCISIGNFYGASLSISESIVIIWLGAHLTRNILKRAQLAFSDC